MSGAVFPLAGNQLHAANPADNVWLSASAGTGKTQVLSARVLRLLLRKDVDPGQILCLTFTKAGAAEMANRINAVLARWVRLETTLLSTELRYLGADTGPETQARARTLFASVLDCPGGGLRIDTIHAFAQWLLANFPGEAELQPGARPMEDRERELLAREVLSDMLDEAQRKGDHKLLDAVSLFTTRKDPDALRGWLMRCASARDMWVGETAWQAPMRTRVQSLLDMPPDADESWADEIFHPDTFPDAQLIACRAALTEWGKPSGQKAVDGIDQWLSLSANDRASSTELLLGGLLNAEGLPNGNLRHAKKCDPSFTERQAEIAEVFSSFFERKRILDLADFLTPALELGRAFWQRWDEAKTREALLDFDDLIQLAADLLKGKIASDWIRYKLDRRFDHILIDEAQDTNSAQWNIVDGLIDDFFSGEGAAGDKLRTIFTVGDYKQAIFGFQGTSPENFARAKDKVRARIDDVRANAAQARRRRVPSWQDLDLGQSFRTSNVVLEFVNRAIDAVGASAFGLDKQPAPHVGDERPGLVTMWSPVRGDGMADDEQSREDDDEQDWLAQHDRKLADKIAEQVRRWHTREEPFILAKDKDNPRAANAGDVMVLVRKRKDLAALIVARLHAKGVPVAGVDRLRLGAPLAVKDLLAALRFAAQPLDDLMLANLLASPLIGWSQDDLLVYVPREKGVRLWDHVRKSDQPFVAETADRLRDLLNLADYETPQALLAWLLIGPWRGRKKLIARLGREANDPIDELVNAAFAYESTAAPSLTGFLQWFDAGESELKREPGEAGEQVRVMTVHGSKGLQAPIVILADAAGRPGKGGAAELEERPIGEATPEKERRVVPLPRLSKEEKAGRISEAEEAATIAEMQEHWRLMYVAMTRAEEGLFITGSLGPADAKNGPHEDSWYARLAPIFEQAPVDDPLWGARQEWGFRSDAQPKAARGEADAETKLPAWARTPIGPEPRPPRPLAPSSAGEDQAADPPLAPEIAKTAARRGVLIHSLLERLPDVKPENRELAAQAWLDRQASDLSEADRAEMAESALGVIADPQFSELFAPDALAEVPLAATVGGIVVAGTIDRLLVREDRITIIDYKTTRRPPASADAIPTATVKQMAAYAAALEVIYPNRVIAAAVLYTQTPDIFALSPDQLAQHKNALAKPQESYPPPTVE